MNLHIAEKIPCKSMPQELDILVLGLHEDAVEAFALRRLCRGAGACERVKDRAA